jgi:HNH endonuclease
MPRCIFCRVENQKLTEEHVFMAAIGGKLTVNGSCVQCNNGLNKAFEEQLTRRLAHFRRIVRTSDRREELPTIDVRVEVNGKELGAKLMSDGTTQLKPVFTKTVKDGVTEIVGEHLTENQKKEWYEKVKKGGWELIEETVTPGGQKADGSFSGELDFIDAPEMLRMVTKTAYTALALRVGADFAMRDTFNDAREFIRTGKGTPSAKLFLNKDFLAACCQGPHQHSVVLVGRKDKHSVDAIVRLYGGLSYFVNLASNYEGADFFDTMVYDAQHGELDKVLVVHDQAEFLQMDEVSCSKKTLWNDSVKSGEWFLKFLGSAITEKPTG